MTPEVVIRALHDLAKGGASSEGKLPHALGLDLSGSMRTRTGNGHIAIVEARDAQGRRVDILWNGDEKSWMIAYSSGDGPQIEPNRAWGRNQIVKPSTTGRGYGILFDAPWPTAITASAPDDRLETITVKRGRTGLDASAD